MHAFRALRHRDYALYFFGQLVSWVGTWMQSVAVAWMVHRITGQPAWLGIVAFASQAPSFVLAPVGGVVADRFRPRHVALVTQALLLGQALAMGWLAWSGHPAVWPIVALSVILGAVSAFDLPARNVLVAKTVPKDDLPNAIALNSALFHGSRIVGPAIAGVLLASAGEAACFTLNAVSYLAALATLFLIRAGSEQVTRSSQSMRYRMMEGARFIWDSPRLRHVFGFMGLIVFLGMPYTTIMPVFADTILKAGPKGMGWLMGAGGAGATLAALLLASWRKPETLPRVMVLSTIGMAVMLSAFAFSRDLRLSMVFIGLASLGLVVTNTGNNTLVNVLIPHELRGRVTSLYAMVFMGAIACGALTTGVLAQQIGAPRTLTAGAAGCVVAALLFGRLYRRHGETGAPLKGSTTTALVAALVVVALAYPSVAGQRTEQGQQGPGFEDLLREYRSGDSAAAVRALAGWSVPRLRALLDQLTWLDRKAVAGGHDDYSPPFTSNVLASVVMLHTEAVLSGAPAAEHLGLIRRALRQLEGRPDARSFVVSWRVVMASYFMSVGRSLDAASLAGAAGDDAETLLLRGAIAEAAASDPSRPVPVNVTLAFGSRPGDWWVQLAEAERDYRAALERDQTLLEARVRLGRVLARGGKADAARETLTEARKQAGAEGFLAYLAALFLGGVNEQAKQIAAAAECYTAAIKMYPEAQTAYIALGHLLDGDGRADEARTTVGRMFAEPGDPARDPWWVYGYAQFWQTDHRVAQLRAFARR